MNCEESKEKYYSFQWDKLGNIEIGRKNLGQQVPVLVYRMMELSMKHALYEEFGAEKANHIFRNAGYVAGKEYAKNNLDLKASEGEFIAEFISQMEALKVGIVRFEKADFENDQFVITVYEDLDCSGLPPTDEVVCNYDEGFLTGVLEVYTGKENAIAIREVDCWANGHRVCRFKSV